MSRRFVCVLLVLVLVGGLDVQDWRVLVHLSGLPAALLLYPFAVAVVVAVLLSPFFEGICLWLLWLWVCDGRLPESVHRTVGWAHTRRPWGYRLRLERRPNQKQPTDTEQPGGSGEQAAGDGEPAAA